MDSDMSNPGDMQIADLKQITSTEGSDDLEQSQLLTFEGSQPMESQPTDKRLKSRGTARVQKRSSIEKKCKCCGTVNTPVWRWGGDAKDTLLCNACSLRIRRSSARPQMSKSPHARGQKRPHQGQDADVPDSQTASPDCIRPLTPEELDALRQKLAGFMFQEKARLLGSDSDFEADWYELPGFSGRSPMMSPHAPAHMSEWQNLPANHSRVSSWHGDSPIYAYRVEHPYPRPLRDQELNFMFA